MLNFLTYIIYNFSHFISYNIRIDKNNANLYLQCSKAAVDFFFLIHILHLLLIILSLCRCKVFISASPVMQWNCGIVMKNSVLDS